MNDHCTASGAERLAERIRQHWASDGHDVHMRLAEEGFSPAMRSAHTDIRSDMVNGLPRGCAGVLIPRKAKGGPEVRLIRKGGVWQPMMRAGKAVVA